MADVARALLVLLAVGVSPMALADPVSSSTGDSTWLWQNRLPQGNPLNTIHCPKDSTNCFALGFGPGAVRFDGTNWSASSTPVGPKNQIFSVSCPSSTRCFAVGGDSNANTGLILTYNGTSWTQMTLPSNTPQLRRVSCPTTSSCYAVSDYGRILTYNGTSWSLATPLTNAGSQYTINDLSCSSTTSCMATTNNFINATSRYYITFNGTSWVENVLPSDIPQPGAVSCVSGTECYATSSSNLLRFNGSAWSQGASFPNSSTTLTSLSCPSSDRCVAVGYLYNSTTSQNDNQVYSYNGTSWSNVSPTVSKEGLLSAVSCSSSTNCYAVTNDAAILSFNGTSSSYVNKTLTVNSFSGMACPSSTLCFAITGSGEVFRYNGTSWSAAYSFAQAGKIAKLSGISCPSTSQCFAVGGISDEVWNPEHPNPDALILSFNGTSWSQVSNTFSYNLRNISCASTTSCQVLVTGQDLIIQYNGVSWTAASQPSYTASSLKALHCPALNVCYAVGSGGRLSTFNGSTWTHATSAIKTSSGDLTDLVSIHCLSTSECFASGQSNSSTDAIIMRLSGGSWSQSYVSTLTTADSPRYYNGVHCTSNSHCVAVGYDTRVFNGSTWTKLNAGIGGSKSLEAVSCPLSTLCFGVGGGGAIIKYQ